MPGRVLGTPAYAHRLRSHGSASVIVREPTERTQVGRDQAGQARPSRPNASRQLARQSWRSMTTHGVDPLVAAPDQSGQRADQAAGSGGDSVGRGASDTAGGEMGVGGATVNPVAVVGPALMLDSGESSTIESLVVAIDGPSGSGKSTVARCVADALHVRYLDTGAMYRAATWWVLDLGIEPTDANAVVAAVSDLVIISGTDPLRPSTKVRRRASVRLVSVDSEEPEIDVTEAVRSAEVTAAVSAVSAITQVRDLLVAAQRAIIGAGGIVVEGRDIGTTVCPSAPVKVFLTASEQARALRRSRELTTQPGLNEGGVAISPRDQTGAVNKAVDEAVDKTVDVVRADLARRDSYDMSRAASPLVPASNAVVLDATHLDIADVVDRVLGLIHSRTGLGSGAGSARCDTIVLNQKVALNQGVALSQGDAVPGGQKEHGNTMNTVSLSERVTQ